MSEFVHASAMTSGELRKFGLLTSVLIILFFFLLIPWIWSLSYPVWPWVVAGLITLWALAWPLALRPVYAIWMKFAEILGWINTRIILSLIFFFIIMPIGLAMRFFCDPMHRNFDNDIDSYRVSSHPLKSEDMERPF